jgi:hypothetical protein
VESLLVDEEFWSRQARVKVRTGHNFWSDRRITIQILHESTDAPFHIVVVE